MTQEIDPREPLWYNVKNRLDLDSDSDRHYWTKLINAMLMLDDSVGDEMNKELEDIREYLKLSDGYKLELEGIESLMFQRHYLHIFETVNGDVTKDSVLRKLNKIKLIISNRHRKIFHDITFSQAGIISQVKQSWMY